MSLKGNLASVNLTEIFQMLSLSGREGTLFIYEGARKRAICFTKEGVSIRSRDRNESNLIGKILVRLGKISEPELTRAVETRRTTDTLLGDVLVDMGACGREDVELAFRIQSEEEIQDLFLNRSDAQFEYVDGYFPETEDTPYVHLNVNSLLIEIARRTDEWEYIRRRIRSPREIYRFTGQEGAMEADVLAECYSHRVDPLIDGTHSVGDVIELSYVNKFEVCKLMAAYLDAGIVELVPPEAIRQNARLAIRMGDAAGAIRHYEYIMSTGDFPLEVMGEAAEAHEANRDFAEAAALLRRLAEELVREGDVRAAIDQLRRVANFPRPEPEALRFLLDLVFEHPREAAEFNAHLIEAGKTLVAYHLKHEQRHEALALLERLVRAFPDEVSFAVSLVNIHYEDGNSERAAAECERLAQGFLKRKRASPAISLYKKLLIIDPDRDDVRDRIRKVASGKRKRSTSSGALPRVAIALGVSLLLGAMAVVFLRQESKAGGAPSGISTETEKRLFGEASTEMALAEQHGKAAVEGYTRLLDDLAGDPVVNSETLVSRLKVAKQRFVQFEEKFQSARQICETIRAQTGQEEVAARARAMLASLRDLDAKVRAARARWKLEAQKTAETLRAAGDRDYKTGRLRSALDRFSLARILASRPGWVTDNRIDSRIANIKKDVDMVSEKLLRARRYEEKEDWIQARRVYLKLLDTYKEADLVRSILLPVEILSVPPGASVFFDDVEMPQKTPAIFRVTPFEKTVVRLEKKGYQADRFRLGPYVGTEVEPEDFQYPRALQRAATWRRHVGTGPIQADPTAWRGRVAVAGRSGRWQVVDAASGREIASDRLEKAVSGVAAGLANDGKQFFVPLLDGRLHVFDAVTCRQKYFIQGFDSGIYAAPAVEGEWLYVAEQNGKVRAYDVSGEKAVFRWSASTAHGVKASPLVVDEHLVVVAFSGDIFVLNRYTGEEVVRYGVTGTVSAAPAVAGKGDIVVGTEQGSLYALDMISGAERWKKNVRAPITRTPVVRGRAVFCSPKPGELVGFDVTTGDEVITVHRDSQTGSRRAARKDNRIFFAHGKTLWAFAPRADGYALAWTFEARGRILAGPATAGRAVYVGDDKGNLYRLEIDD